MRLKLSLILLLLGMWAAGASPATAQSQTLTGWFSFIVADYPPESGLAPEITYTLTEDSGARHELLIDIALMQPLGGPMALNRQRVTVEGEWEEVGPEATEKFRVSFIALAPSPSAASPGGTLAPDVFPAEPPPPGAALPAVDDRRHLRGSQAWVTILCRFADATDETPYPVEYYETIMEGLDPYWREVSYGNINLTGSVVVGWYNLPQPQSYYEGTSSYDTQKMAEDCTTAAEADVFFPDFDGVNITFNRKFALYSAALGGGQILTLDGEMHVWAMTWLPPHTSPGVWAHEMGHGFGLPHSSGPYGQHDPPAGPTTYDSRWDVMSGGAYCGPPDPESDCLAVHTIAYHKDVLGWIPPARKYVAAPNRTQTITLERLAQPGSEGYLMAQIPIGDSTTDFYTVEARLFAGYDEEIPDEAVIIHKVDTTRGDRLAQVVDIDNNGDPNDEGAMWTVGETFIDLENRIRVSIDAASATGYRVTINPDTTFCPEVTLSRQFFGGRGGNASVNVTAPNSCRWTVVSHSPWIAVTQGSGRGDGRVNYTVTANPSLTARTGTLTIGEWTFTVVQAGANGNLFEDDMESDIEGRYRDIRYSGWYPTIGGWSGGRDWARTSVSSRSGSHAWFQNFHNEGGGTALLSPVIDLPEVESATLTFWQRHSSAGEYQGQVIVERQRGEDYRTVRDGERLGTLTFTGTQTTWQKVSLDLSPFVGERIRLGFFAYSDASGTTDGWYIDDIAIFSSDSMIPEPTQAVLENPSPASSQSGVGVISGWACHAHEIVIELNGTPLQAAYGTVREDTRGVCGDTDNGFSLLWNWNNLGAGTHTVRALIDGTEFAHTTVRVTTFGEQFLRGASGTFDLPNFPTPGETAIVRWEEALQNFIITDGRPDTGGGHNQVAGVSAVLENPSLGSAQSGVGVISGWACEAEEIVIELNGTPLPAAYGTVREDTRSVCGDTDNGFSLLWNWNNLGAGTHTVRALLDGVEFAHTTVRVRTFGEQFLRGASGTFPIPDFPYPGETKSIRWEEALQNFVIIP